MQSITLSIQEKNILQIIGQQADALGIDCYAIGGFVRNKLLQKQSKDIDIVCVGDGLELATKVAAALPNNPIVNLFKSYGTAQIKTDDVELEFVGARKESYTHNSRNPLVEPGTLQDDLNRRDFSINTLAICLNKNNFGALLDAFNGVQDVNDGIIRTPQEPNITFSDDPLRMMRAIRFATQYNFIIEPNTLNGIKQNASRIKIIVQERITDELQKIMNSPLPSIGFKLLESTGLLSIIFPEVQNLKGVEVINGKAHKDNFYHTIQVLDNVCQTSNNIWLRWAALLHDIAKPATKRFEPGHGFTFHNHEYVGAKMVPKIFNKLKLPTGAEMRYVQKLVLLHLRPISLSKDEITDSAIRRLLFEAAEEIDDLLLLCHADITSKDEEKKKRYRKNFELVKEKMIALEASDKLRNWQPPITGEDIMRVFNIRPSKPVGLIKDAIKEAILDGIIPNNYDAAYNLMIEEGAKLNLQPQAS
jgi:poly(A) polymerase